jgi:hypothetical protein
VRKDGVPWSYPTQELAVCRNEAFRLMTEEPFY